MTFMKGSHDYVCKDIEICNIFQANNSFFLNLPNIY